MIDEKTEIGFPCFQTQLNDLFGEPGPAMEREYIRVIDLTEFADALGHVLNYEGNPWTHKIYGNFALEGPIKKALRAICGQGLAGELKTYDGCFNIRRMKGGNGYSVHSWGLAIDLNAATNPFGPELITDFSEEFIKCFAQAGFEWGGLWSGNKDAMHWQLCWNRDWRSSKNPLAPIPWKE